MSASGRVHGYKQPGMNQHHLPQTNITAATSSKAYANTNFHFRSQSYESPYSWDSYVAREPASTPPARRSRYGNLLSAESAELHPQHMQLTQLDMQRRGSESSTSSAISNCTATAEGASAWSAATTPETMSPISPNNSLLLHSPPDMMSYKAGLASMVQPASPSKAGHQAPVTCRPSRSRACSHSAPKHLSNSLLQSSVPEEDEQACYTRRYSREHQKTASHEANAVNESTTPAGGVLREAKSVSNLRQRRQQRQQKIGEKAPAKQPVRLRLSPLPPLPLDQQSGRRLSTLSPRTLKPSRSSPQLRDAAGPPPTGPLPPLPNMPNMLVATARTSTAPPTPSYSSNPDTCPPYPLGPPPPPPSRPPPESPGLAPSPVKYSLMPEQQSPSWEEELRRHKKLLEQFPSEPEERQDLPKLSRTHRSLGNIRARSRSLSRATGASSHDDAAIAESRLSHQASSFSLRGSKTMRPSTAKSARDTVSQSRGDQATVSQSGAPHVSIFEDDSEEEGDTVRKFVRNLFTRRTRSGEVPTGGQHTLEHAREVSSGSKHTAASVKDSEGNNGHNDRKKNHSASSAFSIATTVGANTVLSMTSTLAPANTDDGKDGFEVDHSSPRTSSDQSRQHQKGPLLSRMFVRRSH
ncbi:hypothetical protein SBRCBS47491_006328 [Sporothrix bragantina]|uniref:Proteophosphoglycan ppg4 n=1 Tax=Sporothrix bragantina TaxID=671064 RepID=A0ABP0C444_9PEZI